MRVELECRLHGVVAEALAHRLDVDAFLEQQRGVRVSQSMNADRRQRLHAGDAPPESSADDVRILSRTVGPAEPRGVLLSRLAEQ